MRPSELLNSNKEKIRRVVESNNATNPRVFGSVLHRTDREGSDIDLLVDPIRGVTTLLDIAGIQLEVEELLGVPVDVLTPSALPKNFAIKYCARLSRYERRQTQSPRRRLP